MKHYKFASLLSLLFYTFSLLSALMLHSWAAQKTTASPDAFRAGRVNLPVVIAGINTSSPDFLKIKKAQLHTDTPESDKSPANNSVPKDAKQQELPAATGTSPSPVKPKPDAAADKPADAPAAEKPDANPSPLPAPKTEPEPIVEPAPVPPSVKTEDTDLNNYVLDIIKTYQIGNFPYLLNMDYSNYNGVTETLYFKDKIIAKAHPSGNRASHCSGITFEVFMKAMRARNARLGLAADDFNGMTFSQLQDFQMLWYVAGGSKITHNLAAAIKKYGLGIQISRLEDARKGDFLDFSRTNNTGHSVIFLNWVQDNSGKIIGLHYWSSQGSTKGINYVTEYFSGTGKGSVLGNQLYIGRVLPVSEYR